MIPEIIAIGEALVEIMRPGRDMPLDRPGTFLGPYPSGAPAIFADAAARLGARTGFIGVAGALAVIRQGPTEGAPAPAEAQALLDS